MQHSEQNIKAVEQHKFHKEKNLQHKQYQANNTNNDLQEDSDQEQFLQSWGSSQVVTTVKCISDPFDYLEFCQNNKKIKIMDQQNAIFPNVYLKDISLHYKGPMEDKAYSKNYSFYTNVRRGNTLCQIYPLNKQKPTSQKESSYQNIKKNNQNLKNNDQNFKNNKFELFFCRRGMKKFYDLEKQYLATGYEQKLTAQHLKYRRRIFEKIDQVNYEQSKINLYSIFKENGQHCQITYVKRLSTWLFASKNVSILIRDESDLQKYYNKLRFYWAKLIAKQFLSVIKLMPQSQVQALKDQLDTKTLLGEHCGYEQHQHINKYDKVQIIFYGIVQKDDEDHCLPVDYCQDFLARFKFKASQTKPIRNLADKNSVYQNIYSLLKQTAQGSMDQYGQGSVLYVVQQKPNKTQRTIAMCKLKSCQYLIFRRLRQMLKLNVERKSTANTFEKFKFDIEILVSHYFKPPQTLDYYLKVGKQAFNQAGKDPNVTENYLRYKFVEFIQKVQQNSKLQVELIKQKGKIDKKILVICLPRFTYKLQMYAKSNNLPFEYMYRNSPMNPKKPELISQSIHILHLIPRLPEDTNSLENLEIFLYQYSQKDIDAIEEQLKNSKDLTKSHLITFIKSQDKRKSLELLHNNIKSFGQTLKNKKFHFSIIKQEVQDKDEQVINRLEKIRQSNQKKELSEGMNCESTNQQYKKNPYAGKKIFVMFPLLLPGSGKSTLRQKIKAYCEIYKIPFNYVESDQIRKKLMQKNLQYKGMQLNLQTQQFNDTFSEVKEQASEEFMKSMFSIIANYLKYGLKDQIVFADKVFGPQSIIPWIQNVSEHKNVVPILIVPESNELKLKCGSFPFSLQYLLICLKRCLERQEHSTMTRRPQEIGGTFLWFLKLYANISFKKLQIMILKKNPHVEMIKVSTFKQGDVPIHISLRKKLEEAIESNRNKNKIIQLIEEMYKNTEDYLKDSEIQKDNFETVENLINKIMQISSHNQLITS